MMIDAKEIERICELDYSKFDGSESDELDKQLNKQNPKPDMNESSVETIKDFRFGTGATFNVSFTAVLNGGEGFVIDG